jgi:putative LysE/RhtB family amino acid efflux pump
MTVGVFAGSGLWWALLVGVVGWLRSRVTIRGLTWVNRISGAALVGFGLVAVAAAVAAR